MTFCGPARDTVLTNRQTEKMNFDTNYMTMIFDKAIFYYLFNLFLGRFQTLSEQVFCHLSPTIIWKRLFKQ
jgi:hypothetical protein